MTNVLIPCDFTSTTFKLAHQALQAINVKSVNIIFFHLFDMPADFELLDPHRKRPYSEVFTDAFRHQCKQLKDQYPDTIQKVCFKYLEGTGPALFRNFADANEIDIIFCPEHYQYRAVNKMSADPRSVFKKSGVKIVKELAPRKREVYSEDTQLVGPSSLMMATAG